MCAFVILMKTRKSDANAQQIKFMGFCTCKHPVHCTHWLHLNHKSNYLAILLPCDWARYYRIANFQSDQMHLMWRLNILCGKASKAIKHSIKPIVDGWHRRTSWILKRNVCFCCSQKAFSLVHLTKWEKNKKQHQSGQPQRVIYLFVYRGNEWEGTFAKKILSKAVKIPINIIYSGLLLHVRRL